MNEVIAAISTPAGAGAVGMIRISGEGAKRVFARVWISEYNSVDKLETHRFYYGKIAGLSTDKPAIPSLSRDLPKSIDNVLAVWMKAPHSYTGEDVIEIHCHGGAFSTKAVLSAVLNAGARPANPGEFTRRAFLNNKMDLVQAEGVADIINASSERALRIAEEQLNGKLSKEILAAEEELKSTKAFVEATIDFPEEDIEMIEHEKIGSQIAIVHKRLKKLSDTYSEGKFYREGVRVAIIGKPNVGKSSLLNSLVGSDRAIVHQTPGTTRDIIEEDVQIDGINFKLIDTAGLRDALCEIEKIGIEHARRRLAGADLALVVLDGSACLTSEDEKILEETKNVSRILVANKCDICSVLPIADIQVSAKTGAGLDLLKEKLAGFVGVHNFSEAEGTVVTNLRHKKALDETISFLDKAGESIIKKESAEFIAFHMQSAMNSLAGITGEVTTEDVLNEIFSKFCIGK